MNKKNLKNVMMALLTGLIFSVVIVGCSKDKNDEPSGSTDEAAAARVVGTYKGTIHPLNVELPEYFNAIIIITKENGNKVKIAPKSGEAYSGFTTKIIPIQAILSTNNAASEGPEGILTYQDQEKSLNFLAKETSAGDVTYSFEGTKQ